MTQRWILDEIVDPFGARVVVTRDAVGRATSACFDLSGLPRVDALLSGQPVADVPGLVERLCGICPAAHHLAGVRALEALAGMASLPPTAVAVRRLVHHGSALVTHAPRLIADDRELALAVRRFGKAAMAAAGSPGHFPATAIPGGVRAAVTAEARDALAAALPDVLAATVAAAERQLAQSGPADEFDGAEAALADAGGRPDLLGERLRVVRGGDVIDAGAVPADWDTLVAEEVPGDSAPRPYLRSYGPTRGRYRVGPVAQLSIGPLSTPTAAGLQREWADRRTAAAARAVITVHSVEAIGHLLDLPELMAGPLGAPCFPLDGVGVGWVDGPRGLLVHRYHAEAGRLREAVIVTPTAQNEPWLAQLLLAADGSEQALERAVREADPCLPCTSAPAGGMGLVVETVGGTAQAAMGGT